MKILFAILMFGLVGCAGREIPPPDWRLNAHSSLSSSVTAYLVGNTKIADLEFTKVRTEIASTGRTDVLARVELVRCATHVASLEFKDCVAFQKLFIDAADSERVYADYLAGRWVDLNIALLPAQHRRVVAGEDGALGSIEDPLSRLVAAGVLFQLGRMTPDLVTLAIRTASDQGWRRPLLAWLGVAIRRAEKLGNKDKVLYIQRRIDLVTENTGKHDR
jgi:hypothetical protein